MAAESSAAAEIMKTAKPNKLVFDINDCATQSVTIYPTRAAVVRVVEDVVLKSGTNEIIIRNLSGAIDDNTLRVEGQNMNGVITDISGSFVRKSEWDLLPQNSDDSDDEHNDDGEETDEETLKPPSLLSAESQLHADEDEVLFLMWAKNSLHQEEEFLLSHLRETAKLDTAKNPELQKEQLEHFRQNLHRVYRDKLRLTREVTMAEKHVAKSMERYQKLKRRFDGNAKVRALRAKKEEQRRDRERERREAEEQMKMSYCVKIIIESETIPLEKTPTVKAKIDLGRPEEPRDQEELMPKGPYLRVSYITGSASWSPQYHVQLDTVKESAIVTYRAMFTNSTGELWKNANITLSTGQNSFTGLGDTPIPLEPWFITVGKDAGEDAFDASHVIPKPKILMASIPAPAARASVAFCARRGVRSFADEEAEVDMDDYQVDYEDDEEEPVRRQRQRSRSPSHLLLASTTTSFHGTTTIHALPGARTLPSSPHPRRHVISENPIPSTSFHHIIIPAHRPAAFFSARLTLPSSLSLLPGSAGVALDGTFLGSTPIEKRVNGGDVLELPLGIDDAVTVTYPKPEYRKSMVTRGILSRAKVVTVKRTVGVKSARAGKVQMEVRERVPVSRSQDLRVRVLRPVEGVVGGAGEGAVEGVAEGRILGESGSVVTTGDDGKKKVEVRMEGKGEVVWKVMMNEPGEETLELEWEAKLPSDGFVVNTTAPGGGGPV
ncbi:hypothetical protein EX30DRAFT_338127 [Ascodesmis nigricans]|uniref:DUF4139 domain-containing protein n=1 Tax=Ascodesmis nigricans TaxID=341454 RepID=A0A4S2N2R7_9PEZI|nr:hypothetical protein EX30DRAFT_338127 [Ascodesmis nigricans]